MTQYMFGDPICFITMYLEILAVLLMLSSILDLCMLVFVIFMINFIQNLIIQLPNSSIETTMYPCQYLIQPKAHFMVFTLLTIIYTKICLLYFEGAPCLPLYTLGGQDYMESPSRVLLESNYNQTG